MRIYGYVSIYLSAYLSIYLPTYVRIVCHSVYYFDVVIIAQKNK